MALATARGLLAATWRAKVNPLSSSDSLSTQRTASPHSTASSAERDRPEKISSDAALQADDAWEQGEHTTSTHLAEVEMTVGKARVAGHQCEIAVEQQLQTPGRRHPIDQSHHRDRQVTKTSEHSVDVGHEAGESVRVTLQRHVALEIPARAESSTGPGQEHATHVVPLA